MPESADRNVCTTLYREPISIMDAKLTILLFCVVVILFFGYAWHESE